MMLTIWQGYEPHQAVTTRLYFLDAHFPDDKLDIALRWLIKNKLTGKSFVDWVSERCIGSNLEMHRELMKHVEREKTVRKLYAVKDIK